MHIVIVGAGRLATHLAQALHAQGHRIPAVYSRTLAAAQTLAATVSAAATDSLDTLPTSADAFVIAVKDDALPAVIDRLSALRPHGLFFHTAGSVPMTVFQGHAVHYGVVYPLQTFSKERPVDFSRVPFFIEGSDPLSLHTATAIASSLSSDVRQLGSDRRRHLHLAAVFASNFANHCYALAAEILRQQGLPFSVMLPIIGETAAKVAALPPREAQTGPAVRFDEQVMAAQLRLLRDSPLAAQVYELMSQSIHQLAISHD